MKFNKLFNIMLMGAGVLALMGTSCSDDDSAGSFGPVSSRVRLSLASYPTGDGGSVSQVWNKTDKAVLYALGAGESKASYASPILAGSADGDFLFTFEGYRDVESTIASVYPADAPVKFAGESINYNIPSGQNGTLMTFLMGYARGVVNSFQGMTINLRPAYATLAVSVSRGNYSVTSIEIQANGGENLAGDVKIVPDDASVTASEAKVTVTPTSAIDCTLNDATVFAMVAPVTLSAGYTVTVNTSTGKSITTSTDAPVTFEAGGKYQANESTIKEPTSIIVGGSNLVRIIEPALIGSSYKDGLVWEWDATAIASTLGVNASRCDHIDDCKPVNEGKNLLITSSYNWCVLLDIDSKQPLFWATGTTNAHSAELLPNNRLVVACSGGGDQLRLYDRTKSNSVLFTTPFEGAHGVVWMEKAQRLYALSYNKINVYSLANWDTASPSLKLEKSFANKNGGGHDLTYVDDHTLCVSGGQSYLYDINTDTWKELTRLSGSTALKSVNYNIDRNVLWFTDATVPEGSQSWSTHTIHCATDPFGSTDAMTIKIPDMDIYKVRVLNW